MQRMEKKERGTKTKFQVAPGMGFEPMRPRRATGSQGLRVIHSATPALTHSFHYKFRRAFIKLLM
jgi:hypothetical protein